MTDGKTLSQIIAEKPEEIKEPEFFDDPKPVKKGNYNYKIIIVGQMVSVLLVIGGYILIKYLFPDVFLALDKFIKEYIIPV